MVKCKTDFVFFPRSFAEAVLSWGEWMRKGGYLEIRWIFSMFLWICERDIMPGLLLFAIHKSLQIAYVYPDFKTALVGTFQEGQLVSAQEAELTGSLMDYGCIQVPIFSDPKGGSYTREISTFDFVTSTPMLRDPYESRMVDVRQSRLNEF